MCLACAVSHNVRMTVPSLVCETLYLGDYVLWDLWSPLWVLICCSATSSTHSITRP